MVSAFAITIKKPIGLSADKLHIRTGGALRPLTAPRFSVWSGIAERLIRAKTMMPVVNTAAITPANAEEALLNDDISEIMFDE